MNAELPEYNSPVPYRPGTQVIEYTPPNWEAEYGRVYNSKNPSNKASRFVTDLGYVEKNTIDTIRKDKKIDDYKDAKVKVTVPKGTKMRVGDVNQGVGN